MTKPLVGPLCMQCRHIRANWTCDASPRGIPPEIYLDRGTDHTRPVQGDHGIRFEPRPPDSLAPNFDDLMLPEVQSHLARRSTGAQSGRARS